MATDLFNNPSNDYVYPALSPCAGVGDNAYLEFVKDGIGVVSGTSILAKIDFTSLQVPVSAYSVETKILGEREVIYIPGLTKGLTLKQQGFTMPNTIGGDSTNPLFMQIDLSINYYAGFKFTMSTIDVSANYDQNINIADALNIALGNLGVKVSATYDPSILYFKGTLEGYDFNISNVVLTLIDSSENSASPFPYAWTFDLEEDLSVQIPYAKYPNGGMQGIIMKGVYPSVTPSTPYDHWLYINHVPSSIKYYDPIAIDNYITNIHKEQIVIYDPTTSWGPFIPDLSILIPDISYSGSWIYDPSVITVWPQGVPLDGSVSEYIKLEDSSVGNCIISYSEIVNFKLTTNSILQDSSIYGSDIHDTTYFSYSQLRECFISDSSISYIDASSSFIQSSWIRNSWIFDSSITNSEIYDSSVGSSYLSYSLAINSAISESNILSSILTDSSIQNSLIKDSSLINSDLSGSSLDKIDISLGYVFETYSKDSYFYMSTIIDSSILRGVIDGSSFVMGSTLEYCWSNAYKLLTGDPSNPYIWIIDDPTLAIDDPSSRVEIQFSVINDSSLNNIVIKDSSIYDTYIQDASLIRCTLYNVLWDSSTTTFEDCTTIQINLIQDCSISWDVDSSSYYTEEIKLIDVGRNGCSTSNIMSAGDYLEWVTVNDYWNKFGEMYAWVSAADCAACGYSKNLIDGFYVYNPHPFSIKIEYMLIV